MVAGVFGFGAVVLIALALSRAGVPVPASGVQPVTIPAAPVALSRRLATLFLAAAGVASGSWLAFLVSTMNVRTNARPSDTAAADRAWRDFHATLVYGFAVLLPAMAVVAFCTLKRQAETRGLPRQRRWRSFGGPDPVYGEAFRALGRSTAVMLLGSGAAAAWIAWLVARYYGA